MTARRTADNIYSKEWGLEAPVLSELEKRAINSLTNDTYDNGTLNRRFNNIAEDATPEQLLAVGDALTTLHAGDILITTILTTKAQIA